MLEHSGYLYLLLSTFKYIDDLLIKTTQKTSYIKGILLYLINFS